MKTSLVGAAVIFSFVSIAAAKMPSDPVHDPKFTTLPDGKKVTDLKVDGSRLALSRGTGKTFSSKTQKAYEELKLKTQTDPKTKVQWVLMDLENRKIVDQSIAPDKKLFGASTSKIFVAGTLLDKQNGKFIKSSQKQLMADMLVVSSNAAWTNLQDQIGDGNTNRGRERIHAFTGRMGYETIRAFQGSLPNMHGNELTASETAEYLYDMYQGRFAGAEYVWKLLHTSRTGPSRARKYLPTSLYIGGKTGTYAGPSVDPATGSETNADGSTYKVDVANHAIVFNVDDREYGLVVLANTGDDETAALLAGGLFREHFAHSMLSTELLSTEP